MAKRIKDIVFPGRGRRPGTGTPISRYPWDTWFDGTTWKVEGGVDFTSTPANFRQTVYQRARVEDMFVETAIQGDDVLIRAVPMDEL